MQKCLALEKVNLIMYSYRNTMIQQKPSKKSHKTESKFYLLLSNRVEHNYCNTTLNITEYSSLNESFQKGEVAT